MIFIGVAHPRWSITWFERSSRKTSEAKRHLKFSHADVIHRALRLAQVLVGYRILLFYFEHMSAISKIRCLQHLRGEVVTVH